MDRRGSPTNTNLSHKSHHRGLCVQILPIQTSTFARGGFPARQTTICFIRPLFLRPLDNYSHSCYNIIVAAYAAIVSYFTSITNGNGQSKKRFFGF